MASYTMKQHDTAPPITGSISDQSGDVDLTTATTVRLILKGPTFMLVGVTSIVSAVDGSWSYDWQTGDTDVIGPYQGEIEVTWNDGKIETFPNDSYFSFLIVADLGP